MNELDFSEKELQEVLVECIFGKESAWRKLISRYNPLITGTCYKFGRGLVDADELSQLVYEALLKNECEKLRVFKGKTDAEFTSYLFRISRNITWNLLKYENFRESKKDTQTDWEDIPSPESLTGFSPDENKELGSWRAAFATLEEVDQYIFKLKAEEFKFKEIAKILQMPLGTVLWRAKKSRKMLKKFLLEQ